MPAQLYKYSNRRISMSVKKPELVGAITDINQNVKFEGGVLADGSVTALVGALKETAAQYTVEELATLKPETVAVLRETGNIDNISADGKSVIEATVAAPTADAKPGKISEEVIEVTDKEKKTSDKELAIVEAIFAPENKTVPFSAYTLGRKAASIAKANSNKTIAPASFAAGICASLKRFAKNSLVVVQEVCADDPASSTWLLVDAVAPVDEAAE